MLLSINTEQNLIDIHRHTFKRIMIDMTMTQNNNHFMKIALKSQLMKQI